MIEENARTSAEPVADESYSITTEDVTMVFADTAPTQLYGDEYDLVPREKDGKYGIYYHLQYYGMRSAPRTADGA